MSRILSKIDGRRSTSELTGTQRIAPQGVGSPARPAAQCRCVSVSNDLLARIVVGFILPCSNLHPLPQP